MDAEQHLDSYVASFCAFEDGLELELCRTWRKGTRNAAVGAVLDHIISDKERHAAFGWLYLQSRAPHWTAEERSLIGEELTDYVRETELKGYHCPWLAPEHATVEAEADALTAAAGLGGATRRAEEETLANYVANARTKLAEFGIVLPMFETNRMRTF